MLGVLPPLTSSTSDSSLPSGPGADAGAGPPCGSGCPPHAASAASPIISIIRFTSVLHRQKSLPLHRVFWGYG